MAKFITGNTLEKVISDIIWEAENTLLIVSPFIKLDEYFRKLFDKHTNNHKTHIVIVFGKNEAEVSRSLSKEDFEYFKKFLNITIVYVPNLHAKYYGNEKKGVITSINLYDYSFKNNIEFGVFSEQSILSNVKSSIDDDAWNTCKQISESNEVVFVKRPVYEKKLLNILGKNFMKSEILHDITDKFYSSFGNYKQSNSFKKLIDFPQFIDAGKQFSERPTRNEDEKPITGFCIRTGERIPFNPQKPFSYEAYQVWAIYGNYDFRESYCHKTGKPSHGKTSMRNPILQ